MTAVMAGLPSIPPAPFEKWKPGTLEVTWLDSGESGGLSVISWCETVSSLCFISDDEPTATQGIPLHNLKGWAFVPGEKEPKPEMSKPVIPRNPTRRKLADARR